MLSARSRPCLSLSLREWNKCYCNLGVPDPWSLGGSPVMLTTIWAWCGAAVTPWVGKEEILSLMKKLHSGWCQGDRKSWAASDEPRWFYDICLGWREPWWRSHHHNRGSLGNRKHILCGALIWTRNYILATDTMGYIVAPRKFAHFSFTYHVYDSTCVPLSFLE